MSNIVGLREATLDEPICTTVWRDVRKVLEKLFHVMVPRTFSRESQGVAALRDWDLWGPLLICLMLSIFLYFGPGNSTGGDNQMKAAVFAASFIIVWVGSLVITLNALLLGGTFVCILGYCVFPLMVASFLCLIPHMAQFTGTGSTIFRVIVVFIAVVWAMVASIGFFAGVVPEGRKALAMYPVVLFYVVLGWMIILGTNPQTTF